MEPIWQFNLGDFFRDMPEERKRYLEHSTRRVLKKCEFLYHENDSDNKMYYLVEGLIKIAVSTAAGREAIYFIHKPGSLIGITGVVTHQPRTTDLQALAPSVVYEINSDDFDKLLSMFPHLSKRVMEQIQVRIRYLIELSAGLMYDTAETRLIRMLSFLYHEQLLEGKLTGRLIEIDKDIVQNDIASSIGTSRQTVNSIFRRLEHESIITVSAKKIIINDPTELLRRLEA
jgi:CRP/FNR family transcriptional regulator